MSTRDELTAQKTRAEDYWPGSILVSVWKDSECWSTPGGITSPVAQEKNSSTVWLVLWEKP